MAAVVLALAVSMGAFGAHGLQGRLDDYSMGVYQKAVLYHFFHALGLLAVGVLQRVWTNGRSLAPVAWLLLVGIVLFSGSLYVLAVTGVRMLGAVTPFGGVAFIAAWVLLAVRASGSGNTRP